MSTVADTEKASQTDSRPGRNLNVRETVGSLVLAALLGAGLGIGISDGRASDVALSWIGLPGDLFIRALKCIVLPLVFVNIILAVINMMKAGKASVIGKRTFLLYLFTTVVASTIGCVSIAIFSGSFSSHDLESTDPAIPEFLLACPSGGYLMESNDTGLACGDGSEESASTFLVQDINSYFVVNSVEERVANDISLSDTIQDGIFRTMVPENILNEFVETNFLGVVCFAIVFGAAAFSVYESSNVPAVVAGVDALASVLAAIDAVFIKIVMWLIKLTPIAVLSLIASNLGSQDDLVATFSDIGFLMLSSMIGWFIHFFIVYPSLFVFFVRENPIGYYKFLIPAQLFGFACSSSAATLPINMECVKASGQVPETVRNFVLTMGATLNMDGTAIYFPNCIIYLAIAQGLGSEIDASSYILAIIIAVIGSAGTAPVPHGSLVLIITAYNTIFDGVGTPDAFGLILAIDWFMNRIRVIVNVTGDAVIARIVAEHAKGIDGIKDEALGDVEVASPNAKEDLI